MAADRVDGEGIELTHEFLATMLGVHRPSVTIAVQEFERHGLIDAARGTIIILDRDALETRGKRLLRYRGSGV
jgi:CRP-like cAMP-binding protein